MLLAKKLQEATAYFRRKISNAQQREGLKSARAVVRSKRYGEQKREKREMGIEGKREREKERKKERERERYRCYANRIIA